jgi:hypothetical protein
MVMMRLLLTCLWVCSVQAPDYVDLSLNLLEEVLEPLAAGGSCNKISRLTKAIVGGTKGAHHSIQQIAAMRGDKNFERSLHRWAKRQPFAEWLPKPYPFNLLKDTTHGTAERVHHAILPHDLFSQIFHKAEDLFSMLFTGPPGNLEDWWRSAAVEGGSWLRLHPVVASQPDSSKRVPFGIHGDDAGVQGPRHQPTKANSNCQITNCGLAHALKCLSGSKQITQHTTTHLCLYRFCHSDPTPTGIPFTICVLQICS